MTTRTFPKLAVHDGKPRLLIVEDDDDAAFLYERHLQNEYRVTVARDGIAATTLLQNQAFDIVLSDIRMPGITGVELLRLIRTYNLEIPVLLMSEVPELDGAMQAVDLGALGYIRKSNDWADLSRRLAKGISLSKLAAAKREALELQPPPTPLASTHAIGDIAGLSSRFESALEQMHLSFQPIVSVSEKRIVAYEALMRSREPLMSTPLPILDAAERLGQIDRVTSRVLELAADVITLLPEDAALFINIHANDLQGSKLGTCAIAKHAARIVLEITERYSVDGVSSLGARSRALRAIGYRLAIDDLGAGYAGLTTFANVEPEIVKLDMSLIRNIDSSIVRQRIVQSLITLCRDLSMDVVAEGIETRQELATVNGLGCDWLQGYFFARPAESFAATFQRW